MRRDLEGLDNRNRQGVRTVVFDAYGTLFDVDSLNEQCDREYPGQGIAINREWRQKQLGYTWLRTLMKRYADFESITHDALKSTLGEMGLKPTPGQLRRLSTGYLTLSPFPDAKDTLMALCSAKRLAILSNGTNRMLQVVVGHSRLSRFFERIMSVERVRSYKPDPSAYRLAMEELNVTSKRDILYVSANEWDAAGAKSFGYTVTWINRKNAPFRNWPEYPPDHQIKRLSDLITLVENTR